MSRASPYTPIHLKLETPAGSHIQLNVWMQEGQLRLGVDGLLNAAGILEPESVRKACVQILDLLNRTDSKNLKENK